MIKALKQPLNKLFCSKNSLRLIIALGIAGMLLIAFSGSIFGNEKESTKAEKTDKRATVSDDDNADDFRENVKAELEYILNNIDGVSDCSVMLSIEGTREYIFAENTQRDQEYSSNGSNERTENEIMILDNTGDKQALLRKIIYPKITGAVVVCRGGGDVTVKERVIKAVSTALDLPYGKICVEGKN